MSSRNTDSSLDSSPEASSRRVNRRFLAYVEQASVRQTRQRRRLLILVCVLVSAMLALIVIATLHNLQQLLKGVPGFILVVGFGVLTTIRKLLHERQNALQMRSVLQNGVPVNVFLVQANAGLLRTQPQTLPCLVLLSFQPEVSGEIDYMQSLARRVYSLKNTHPEDKDEQFVASLTTDERSVPGRRRQLPLSFTDGSTIYCVDLVVRPAYLQASRLQSDVLPCIAEPGWNGGIELVPYWLLQESEQSLTTVSPAEGSRLGL